MKCYQFFAGIFLLLAPFSTVRAGLEVTENIGDGSETKWPQKAVVTVVADPEQARAGANVDAKTVLTQTFTPTRSFTLDKILIRYSTKMDSGTFILKIQAVPEKHEAMTYAEGKNLFTDALKFYYKVNTQGKPRMMEFKFTDADKISLQRGVTYALEIAWVEGAPLTWNRRAADEYDKGRAYVNRDQLSGSDEARDMAMIVISGP